MRVVESLVAITLVFFILSAAGEVYGTCWALWGLSVSLIFLGTRTISLNGRATSGHTASNRVGSFT